MYVLHKRKQILRSYVRSGVGPGARGTTRVGVTHPAQKRPRVDIFNFQKIKIWTDCCLALYNKL